MTCSPSFLRIRPWSTNTHVSWSPIARWTSSAATDESTPPERPQITRPSPTWVRIFSICSSMIEAGLQVRSQPQMSSRNVVSTCWPYGVWTTSGWNWMPYNPRSTSSSAATGDSVELASAVKPGGGAKTVSRCDIQQDCSGGVPASSRPGSAHGQLRAPELPHLGALDLAAERQHQRLHAVTDAEHRDPELEQLRLEPRRALGVHRGRPAGQDQALRPPPADLLDADVVRQQLGEHPALAHPPRDQLRVLPAVVEHHDLVGRDLALEGQLLQGLVGRDGRPVPLGSGAQSATSATPPPRAPMPICWSRWSCLPSVCSAGAIISSARLNSAMSW